VCNLNANFECQQLQLPTATPVPADSFQEFRRQGRKVSKADRLYFKIVKENLDWYDWDPEVPNERMSASMNGEGGDRLPAIRAFHLADHRLGIRDIEGVSARLKRKKRRSLMYCIRVTGSDSEAFIQRLDATYCDNKLYHEAGDECHLAWMRLDLARPVSFYVEGNRTLAKDTQRQNHKLDMITNSLVVLARFYGFDVDSIEAMGHASEVRADRRQGQPGREYQLAIVRRGRHLPLPRCSQDSDVARWRSSRFSGDLLLASLYNDVLESKPAFNDMPTIQHAYEFVCDETNCRVADLLPTNRPRSDDPLRTPYFTLADDWAAADKMVRSAISSGELDNVNATEADKLGGIGISYAMLALTLCIYAKNAFTRCGGGERSAVPVKSVQDMLYHFGCTRIDRSHVRVLRDLLKSTGFIYGDGVHYRRRCERFRICGAALDLPFLANNPIATAERAERDAARTQAAAERARTESREGDPQYVESSPLPCSWLTPAVYQDQPSTQPFDDPDEAMFLVVDEPEWDFDEYDTIWLGSTAPMGC
jgi:hypothetical protein